MIHMTTDDALERLARIGRIWLGSRGLAGAVSTANEPQPVTLRGGQRRGFAGCSA